MKTIMTILLFAFSNIVYAQFTDFVEFNGEVEVSYNPASFFGPEKMISNRRSGLNYLFDYKCFSKVETKVYLGGCISTINVYRFDSVASIFGDYFTIAPYIEVERNNFIVNFRYSYDFFRGKVIPKFRKLVFGDGQSSFDHKFDIGVGKRIPISKNHLCIGLNIGFNSHQYYFGTKPQPVKNTPVFTLEIKQRIAATDIFKLKRIDNFIQYFGKYLVSAKMRQIIKPNFYGKTKSYHNAFADFYFGKFIHRKVIFGVNCNIENTNQGNLPVLDISIAPEVHYSLYQGWYLNTVHHISYNKTNVKYLTWGNKLGFGTFFKTHSDCIIDVCFYASYFQFYGTFDTGKITRFQNIFVGGLNFRYHFIL